MEINEENEENKKELNKKQNEYKINDKNDKE